MYLFSKSLLTSGSLLVLSAYLAPTNCFAKGAAAPATADQIIDTFVFDDGCDAGPWTKQALNTAQSITAIYTSLQKKTNCTDAGLSPSIYAANSITNTLQQIDQMNAARAEKVQMETLSDLLTSLQDPHMSPKNQETLMDAYTRERVDLAHTRGQLAASSGLDDARIYYGLMAISQNLNTLVSQRAALASCFTANPVEAVKVATNLADLAGNFLPGLSGEAIKAGASVTRAAIDIFQNAPIAAVIRRSQSSRLSLGMRCGMQTLEHHICKARDAGRMATYLGIGSSTSEPSDFFYGLDLIDNRFPSLDAWLDRVASGVSPKTGEAASRLNGYFRQVYLASKNKRSMDGEKAELMSDLGKITTFPGKVDRVKQFFANIIAEVWGADIGGNHYANEGVFTGRKTAVELVDDIFNSNAVGQQDFSSYLGQQVKQKYQSEKDLDPLIQTAESVFATRQADITRDFNEHVNVDSPTLIRAATSPLFNKNSPIEVLGRIGHFFDVFSFSREFGSQDKILIDDLKVKLQVLSSSLNEPDATTEQKANIIIADTFDSFRLGDQNVFLNQRLRALIANDLQNRIKEGALPKEIHDIAWMANQDLLSLFSQTNQNPTRRQILDDVAQGQQLSMDSLANFSTFFSNGINSSMQRIKQSADQNREPTFADIRAQYEKDPNTYVEAPNRMALAQICFVSLATSDKFRNSNCAGAIMISNDAHLILDYDKTADSLKTAPFQDRVCLYEDFVKKDRIAATALGRDRRLPLNLRRNESLREDLQNLVEASYQ